MNDDWNPADPDLYVICCAALFAMALLGFVVGYSARSHGRA